MSTRERIVVAMSGGVDSSTAAALLHEAGAEVIGVTLRLSDDEGVAPGGRCCSPMDIEDARATAAALGFAHYVLDRRELFRRAVIDDFVAEHRAGRTPSPCVRCNQHLKFGPLLAVARALGAEALATGHYARIDTAAGVPRLLRARDRDKDQSYFLFGVAADLLARVRFPLGEMTKTAVRAAGRRLGVPSWDKPDSQQLCFVPDGNHVAFVERHGGAGRPGPILDHDGRILGAHAGTHRFTIGQRRGLPVVDGQARFVAAIDPGTGTVQVAPRERAGRRRLHVGDVRWLHRPPQDRRCDVQIRHRGVARAAWVQTQEAGSVAVEFDVDVEGASPGQAAVFFDGDQVLGGGFIAG